MDAGLIVPNSNKFHRILLAKEGIYLSLRSVRIICIKIPSYPVIFLSLYNFLNFLQFSVYFLFFFKYLRCVVFSSLTSYALLMFDER